MNNDQIVKIFKALSDETRIKIIKLIQKDKICACRISDELNLLQSKLSYHMKILCDSGIIKCSYKGKWTFYEINENGCQDAIQILKKLIDT